jgi:DinB family protein
MDDMAAWRRRLRATRAHLLDALAGLDDAGLERRWTWRDGADELRFALLRVADDEEEATIGVVEMLAMLGWRQPQPQRILGLAEISRGWLLGELVGVPDDLLDRAPAPGEWPLRRVLAHMIVTERRYHQRSAWDIAEARAGCATGAEPPAGVVEPLSEAAKYEHGTVVDLVERLATVREEALAALADCTASDLETPSSWAGHAVDVRFRLHRFAAHERQHTVQVAKTLRGVGFAPTEAQRLLAQAQVTRGQLLAQLVGLPDELLNRAPAPSASSIAAILTGLVESERERVASARAALATGAGG